MQLRSKLVTGFVSDIGQVQIGFGWVDWVRTASFSRGLSWVI